MWKLLIYGLVCALPLPLCAASPYERTMQAEIEYIWKTVVPQKDVTAFYGLVPNNTAKFLVILAEDLSKKTFLTRDQFWSMFSSKTVIGSPENVVVGEQRGGESCVSYTITFSGQQKVRFTSTFILKPRIVWKDTICPEF